MGGDAIFLSALVPPDTQALARGLRRRDPELLDSLIEQYQYRLYRYLISLTAHRETAEDLFQETWVRVLDRGHQYDGKSKFETWLFAIARHLVIDAARRKKPDNLDALLEEPAAPNASSLDLVASQETQKKIQASLGQLPAVYREVLVLRFHEDLQLDEIAGVIGAPLSTVKSRLYRGLESLRGLLGGIE